MLKDQTWTPVSIHSVVLAFLQAERHAYAMLPEDLGIIDTPKIEDPHENHRRLRLLYKRRLMLFAEVPPDTQWYEVRSLTDSHLGELHVIARCDFMPADAPTHLLTSPDHRKAETLRSAPPEWKPPVLWGHTMSGPFTILEGNHRLAAYVAGGARELQIPVYIGLSRTHCFWHSFDPPEILANDLFPR